MKIKLFNLLMLAGLSFINLQASEYEFQNLVATGGAILSTQKSSLTAGQIELENFVRAKKEKKRIKAQEQLQEIKKNYDKRKRLRDLEIDELTNYVNRLRKPSDNKNENIDILTAEVEHYPGYTCGSAGNRYDYCHYSGYYQSSDVIKIAKDINPQGPTLTELLCCFPCILFCETEYDYWFFKPEEASHEVILGHLKTVLKNVQAKIDRLHQEDQQDMQYLAEQGIDVGNQPLLVSVLAPENIDRGNILDSLSDSSSESENQLQNNHGDNYSVSSDGSLYVARYR